MKGIMFKQTEEIKMFQAVIEGRKTQTRRIVNPNPDDAPLLSKHDGVSGYMTSSTQYILWNGLEFYPRDWDNNIEACLLSKPRYKVGETVYLKEPYFIFPSGVYYLYLEDDPKPLWGDNKWKNKMFMRAEYARFFIEITDVRVERLQDISEEDALLEGGWEYKNCPFHKNPIKSFQSLIDAVNKKGTWESNPWVWVYEFKLK